MPDKICPIMSRPVAQTTFIDNNPVGMEPRFEEVKCLKHNCACWDKLVDRCGLRR